MGPNETALRCTAIQMLLSGISRDQVVEALLVTERALRKWIKLFNERGVDGLIVKKRPGRTAILGDPLGTLLTNVTKSISSHFPFQRYSKCVIWGHPYSPYSFFDMIAFLY